MKNKLIKYSYVSRDIKDLFDYEDTFMESMKNNKHISVISVEYYIGIPYLSLNGEIISDWYMSVTLGKNED